MSDQWFLYKDKQQKGPYSFQQLTQDAAQGLIKPEDKLWSKGMEGWTRADQIEGLLPSPPPVRQSVVNVAEKSDYQVDVKMFSQLTSWIGFVGIMMIIGGVISAISGLFAFIIGSIPGIMTLILGLQLRKAKKHADAMLADHSLSLSSANFEMFAESLRSYFKIMGILIIIALILSLLGIIFGLVASFMMPDMIENLVNLLG